MANDFKFDNKEFKKYLQNFEKMVTEFDTWLKTFLLQQAQRCVANAKKRTPVDTGALRASWGIGTQVIILKQSSSGKMSIDPENSTIADIKVVGDNLEVTIWNGMEYASYVEYGHTTKGRGGWIDGEYMLTISITEVERAMPSRFNREFEQFLKRWDVK